MRRLTVGVAALVVVFGLAGRRGTAAVLGDVLQTFHIPLPDSGYDGYGDRFGMPVVPLGNSMVLVGAMQAGGIGNAYLFDAVTGATLHTFVNPNSRVGDGFGYTIATMGDRVLIGAPMGAYGNPGGSGAVYLFTHNTSQDWDSWTLSHTFSGPAGANFGAVAVVGGDFLIGASGDHAGHPGGAAYLYDGSTYALLHTFNNPNATARDGFGSAIAGSGSTVIIGAPGTQSQNGAVYKYDSLILSGSRAGSSGQLLGDSVALAGNNVLAGASYDHSAGNQGGAVYLLDGSTPSLNEVKKYNNPHQGVGYSGYGARFGSTVAANGNTILASAPWDDAAGPGTPGACYLLDSATGNPLWTGYGEPSPPTVYPGDNYGHGPSFMGDNILVGAVYADSPGHPNAGAAFLVQGVPEPSTFALLATGAIGLMGWAWRRRKA